MCTHVPTLLKNGVKDIEEKYDDHFVAKREHYDPYILRRIFVSDNINNALKEKVRQHRGTADGNSVKARIEAIAERFEEKCGK